MSFETATLLNVKKYGDYYYVTAKIDGLELGVQPASVSWLTPNFDDSIKLGEIFEVDKVNPLYVLDEANLHDPWILFGSNINSGTLLFGTHQDIYAVLSNFESKIISFDIDPDSLDSYGLSVTRWNFDDNNSLCLVHTEDIEMGLQDEFIEVFKHPNVLASIFGAITEDHLSTEILSKNIIKALKSNGLFLSNESIKIIKGYGQFSAISNTVNGKDLSPKNNGLVLDAAYHMFCSILSAHKSDKDDELDKVNTDIANQLIAYKNKG